MSRVAALLLILSTVPMQAGGDVPESISHQGMIILPGGRVPLDGTLNLLFAFHDSPSGGSALLQVSKQGVDAKNGLYSVALDGGPQPVADALAAGAKFLEVTIEQAPLEPDLDGTILSPRQFIGSVPYAFRAARAEAILGPEGGAVPTGGIVLWDQATGCAGAARSCPCGYEEAGEFRGRTARSADIQGVYPDLPDEIGLNQGVPVGIGMFGDTLTEEQAPSHSHSVASAPTHTHQLSSHDINLIDDRHVYFWKQGTGVGVEDDSEERHGSAEIGATFDEGAHYHLVAPGTGGPHTHPLRTVLFCRRMYP